MAYYSTGSQSRAYGKEMESKDAGSIFLRPGEQPRVADPFVDRGSSCPRCGHTDRITWHLNKVTLYVIVECDYCGYYKERFTGATIPMTDEMIDRPSVKMTKVCSCGREFKTNKNHTHCKKCRQQIIQRRWREENPEAYRAIKKKHNALERARTAKRREAAKEFL